MRDAELQEAIESLLWSLYERTRCPVCYKIKSHGHTKNCRVGKLHAILNSRVNRVESLPLEPESEHPAAQHYRALEGAGYQCVIPGCPGGHISKWQICTAVKASECLGCKEGWHRQGSWHWDSIGHMHECTSQNGKGDV